MSRSVRVQSREHGLRLVPEAVRSEGEAMTDISKCDGERCSRKDKCHRHVASEDDLWQSWTASPPLCEDGCADFIPVREEEGKP